MTTKEKILEEIKDINYAYNDCSKYAIIKNLLDEMKDKKDIPMMVTDESGDCPACLADNFYTMYDMMDSDHYNYCANCGQRLDWTEYNKRIGLHIIKLEKKDNDN